MLPFGFKRSLAFVFNLIYKLMIRVQKLMLQHSTLSKEMLTEYFNYISISGPIEQLPDYNQIRNGMFWMRS